MKSKHYITIGSASTCDLRIAEEYVSRKHCAVFFESDTVWIEDLGSSNGTVVDGYELSSDERVRITSNSNIELAEKVTVSWYEIQHHRSPRSKYHRPNSSSTPPPGQRQVSSGSTPGDQQNNLQHGSSPHPSVAKDGKPSASSENSNESESLSSSKSGVDEKQSEKEKTPPDQHVKAQHEGKSYVSKAFLSLVLYWILFIPGFITNLVFLGQANKTRRITGRSPSGRGCLIMLFLFHVVPILFVLLLVVAGGLSLRAILQDIIM